MDKKTLFQMLAIVMIAILSVGFSSCGGKEEEEDNFRRIGKDLIGAWKCSAYENPVYLIMKDDYTYSYCEAYYNGTDNVLRELRGGNYSYSYFEDTIELHLSGNFDCKVISMNSNYIILMMEDGNSYTYWKQSYVYDYEPQAYTVSNNDGTTLTYYYDGKRVERKGKLIGTSYRVGESEKLTSVTFDASFANYNEINSTDYWFKGCKNLKTINGLNNLNTSNVTSMEGMFYDCPSLTSLDLSSFNTSNVTSMDGMFYKCSSLIHLDISNFNTLKVTSMQYMFYWCPSLTSLDLSSFNTSNVTSMNRMFLNCSSLNKIYVSDKWVECGNGYLMFSNCTSLVGGKGTTFSNSNINSDYAHIDGGASNPGYLTAK